MLKQISSWIYEILQGTTDGKPELYLIYWYIRGNVIVMGKSAPFHHLSSNLFVSYLNCNFFLK